MKIAIIGLDSMLLAGVPDGFSDWQLWYMGQDLWSPANAVFEMHERSHWGSGERLEYLKKTDATVYLRDPHSDLPRALAYPMDAVADAVGREYFECTAAYMLGLAIMIRPREIGLWGISGAAECAEQRPNLEYLIGVAEGRRIKVTIAEGSELFKSAWSSGIYGKQDRKAA